VFEGGLVALRHVALVDERAGCGRRVVDVFAEDRFLLAEPSDEIRVAGR
jgi:hypothetical protein